MSGIESLLIVAAGHVGIRVTGAIIAKFMAESPRGLADVHLSTGDQTVEAYREVETPGIVKQITNSSVQFDGSTNELTSYFFYSRNNFVIEQIRGPENNYFAFDSISDMFEAVSVWNYMLATLSPEWKRTNKIYMLDPHPAPKILSHMEFTEHYQNVRIVNHHEAKPCFTIYSVKVHKGCSVRFEHLTICHSNIDVTHGGSAYFHQCNVGFYPPALDSPTTCLFLGKPSAFYNRQDDSGEITFRECSLTSPPKGQRNSSPMFNGKCHQWNNSPRDLLLSITNISDKDWYVGSSKFRWMCQIPPFGGNITLNKNDLDVKGRSLGGIQVRSLIRLFLANMHGLKLTFKDGDGGEYIYPYDPLKTEFTIVSSTILSVVEGKRETTSTKYSGEFEGIYKYVNSDEYSGEWKDGKRHGQGKLKWANGDEYSGGWNDGTRHGQGVQYYLNGDLYSGEWKDDKRHGHGSMIYASTDEYVGEWKDGKRHGQGTIKYANGVKYSGEWKRDRSKSVRRFLLGLQY